MWPLADLDPIRPVVGIAVGIVQQARMFDQQRPGMLTRRIAALPAERAASDRLLESSDGPRDHGTLLLFAQQEMPDEAIAMATEVKTVFRDGLRDLRIARQRLGAGIDCQRDAAISEKFRNAPESDSRTVFEQRLRHEIA